MGIEPRHRLRALQLRNAPQPARYASICNSSPSLPFIPWLFCLTRSEHPHQPHPPSRPQPPSQLQRAQLPQRSNRSTLGPSSVASSFIPPRRPPYAQASDRGGVQGSFQPPGSHRRNSARGTPVFANSSLSYGAPPGAGWLSPLGGSAPLGLAICPPASVCACSPACGL